MFKILILNRITVVTNTVKPFTILTTTLTNHHHPHPRHLLVLTYRSSLRYPEFVWLYLPPTTLDRGESKKVGVEALEWPAAVRQLTVARPTTVHIQPKTS